MLSDLNGLFKDSMLHLGGDEIDLTCFDENPNIQAYMQKMGIQNYTELIVSHMAKVRKMLNNMSPQKRAIYWSSPDTFYQRY